MSLVKIVMLTTELRGLCLGIEAPCHVNILIGPIDWTVVYEEVY